MSLFHEKIVIKLLKMVKQHPVLYDNKDPHYMDFNAREVVWHKIGDDLQRPAAICKAKWINIRDTYRRLLRWAIAHPNKKHKKYKYHREMAFIRPFYKDNFIQNYYKHCKSEEVEADCVENVDDHQNSVEDSDDDSDDDSAVPIKKLKIRKKKHERSKGDSSNLSVNETVAENKPSDPVDAFLLSIGATLKTFSPYHLNLAKSKIFAVVQEHELQQLVNTNSQDNIIVKVSTTDQYSELSDHL